jgi:hypothetical protein
MISDVSNIFNVGCQPADHMHPADNFCVAIMYFSVILCVILYDEKWLPDFSKHTLLMSSAFGSTSHYELLQLHNHQIMNYE